MILRQWRDNGWLVEHRMSREEIQNLFDIAARDLRDAQAGTLSTDNRFHLAYNAALQLAIAALSAAGYRPAKGQSHHLRAIESLRHTIAAPTELVDQLDVFRAKRHRGLYDLAGAVSDTEADAMITLTKELRRRVADRQLTTHPQLMPS